MVFLYQSGEEPRKFFQSAEGRVSFMSLKSGQRYREGEFYAISALVSRLYSEYSPGILRCLPLPRRANTIAGHVIEPNNPMFRPDNSPPDLAGGRLHVVFHRGQLLSDMRSPQLCLIEDDVLERGGWRIRRRHFMGYWGDRPCFALEIDEKDEPDAMQYHRGNLYQLLGRVDDQVFALVGRASQLLDWERDHRYCGRCGRPMEADQVERAMCCPPCGTINYPRIAPCVIVLVTRGDEMLLAHNMNFPGPHVQHTGRLRRSR